MSIREKYNIPLDGKILLYVGNISENKNQRQMVEAYSFLPEEFKKNTWILFCGGGDVDGLRFTVFSLLFAYKEHIILCGAVEKLAMVDYFREADGVVLLSHAEGFGLSLIEGMHFGVPCAMFSDMDAFSDIYDERAVVAIDQRSNKAVAEALQKLLSKSWDRDEIIQLSKRFNAQSMALNYKKVYELL